jgi:hypothetical protein
VNVFFLLLTTSVSAGANPAPPAAAPAPAPAPIVAPAPAAAHQPCCEPSCDCDPCLKEGFLSRLLGRFRHSKCCEPVCEPCCPPAPAPSCCKPAPAPCCEPDPCCPPRKGFLSGLFGRLRFHKECDDCCPLDCSGGCGSNGCAPAVTSPAQPAPGQIPQAPMPKAPIEKKGEGIKTMPKIEKGAGISLPTPIITPTAKVETQASNPF